MMWIAFLFLVTCFIGIVIEEYRTITQAETLEKKIKQLENELVFVRQEYNYFLNERGNTK